MEHPILFSGEMVRAIFAGRKTQTRRVIKLPEESYSVSYWKTPTGRPQEGFANPGVNYWTRKPSGNHIDPCPYGFVGDHLWVRETWGRFSDGEKEGVCFRADGEFQIDRDRGEVWRPSIFMPRAISRLTLEITGLRVERLQDISDSDARAEGCQGGSNSIGPRYEYADLWNCLNAPRGYGWDANPWVWVIEFKRTQP